MISLPVKLFLVGFFLNLLYELLHSLWYTTCLEAPLKKYVYLILKAAAFDGFAIVILYTATFFLFQEYYQLVAFAIAALVFAYGWELYSLKAGKWEYANTMPKILGAGITPTIQLALTGILAIYLVFNLFV